MSTVKLTPVDLDQWIRTFSTVVSNKKYKRYHFLMPVDRAQVIFKYKKTMYQILGKKAFSYVEILGKRYLSEYDSLKLEKLMGGQIRCDIFVEKIGDVDGQIKR